MRRFWWAVTCACALAVLAGGARAQTARPTLLSVFPPGLQRGTTAEITLTGAGDLADASRALVEGPGLTAEILSGPAPAAGGRTSDTLRVRVTAAVQPAYTGLLEGNPQQLVIQLLAVGATVAFAVIATFVIVKLVDVILGIRVSAKDEEMGIDLATHGEAAYQT